MTRTHDNDRYYREQVGGRTRSVAVDKGKYACIYCGQRCSSTDILVIHERSCPRRAGKEQQWRRERGRHASFTGGINKDKNGEKQK